MSRILGIDFGTRRIGLALSDPTGTLASPLPCLENTRTREVVAKLNELIQLHGVESIVIGLPRNMDGSYGPSAEKVRQFIAEMETQISAKFFAQDERLTTRQATRDLSGFGLNQKELRQKVDSAAATIILQQFLDRTQSNP